MATVQYTHYSTAGAADAVPIQVNIPLDEVTAIGATGTATIGGAFLTLSADSTAPDWSTTPDPEGPDEALELPAVGSFLSVDDGIRFLVLLFAIPVNYGVKVHCWRMVP